MVSAAEPLSPTAVAAVHDARERLRRIEAVTDIALSKLTLEDLLDELLTRMREVLDVDTSAVLLLDQVGGWLSPVAAKGLEEEVRQGVRIPLGRGFAGQVAATARPVVIAEVNPSNVVNPILIRKQIRSVVGVPLLDGDTVIGVLHVGSLQPRDFGADDIAVLQLAAERVAGAISSRQAYIDRAAALSLQRSLAPRQLPAVDGYDLAARYSPGSQYGVGGDWYDVFVLPSGHVGIVIGDVMGHGLHAATVMGRLKSALRAYALDHDEPAAVLHHLDRKIQHFEPGQMATVVYGVLDPQAGIITLSSAGHLPLVLVRSDHRAELVVASTGLPLGVDLTRERTSAQVCLDLGSTLTLFTDGLIDQRNVGLDAGLVQVRETLESASGGAETACIELMSALVGQRQLDDDVTMLTLRRAGPG